MKNKNGKGIKNKNVRDSELYELKQRGWSYRRIAKYYEEKGIKITASALQLRCVNIYRKLNKEVPKTTKRANDIYEELEKKVSNEEIFKLKQERYTYQQIQDIYKEKGITISINYICKVCKKECERRGIKKIKKGIPVSAKKYNEKLIFELRERKLSYQKIAEYLQKEYGTEASYQTIRLVCKKIYKQKQKEEPKIPRNNKAILKISNDEIAQLKIKGYSYREMVTYFASIGKKCSRNTLANRSKLIFGVTDKGNYSIIDIRTANPEVVKNALINLKHTKGATNKQIKEIANYYGIDFNNQETEVTPYGIYDLSDKDK